VLPLQTELIVDATGVGVAVTDLLRERNLKFRPVTITGGDVARAGVTKDRMCLRVLRHIWIVFRPAIGLLVSKLRCGWHFRCSPPLADC
jgi:hypothetical protein